MKRIIRCLLALVLVTTAHATVTNVAWYRLGENDPGGVSGLTVTNTTADIIGTNQLKQYGSPLYTNAVSASAASQLGSSLAVHFNGSSQYLSNAVVSTAVGNFGIEAWVNPNTTNAGNQIIAYNGNTGADGWGIVQNGGNYIGLFGGKSSFGNGTVVTGAWVHVALVRDGNMSTLYVNGVAAGSVSGGANAPLTPTTGFAIGGHPQSSAGEYFNGAIDEVRVFTFAAGQFSTNDPLLNFQFVATLPATNVASASPALNGSANPSGLPTSAWFQWGTTTSYGNLTTPQFVGNGNGNTNFSQSITGLSGGTYHFRAVASNSVGVFFGTNQSFDIAAFLLQTNILQKTYASSIAWADYDRDGRLDILFGGGAPFIQPRWLERNTGSGFTDTVTSSQGYIGVWLDCDSDGFPDVLWDTDLEVPTHGQTLNQNLGNGAFSPFATLQTATAHSNVTSLAVSDYDADGRADFLVSGLYPTGYTELWRNAGNGYFGRVPIQGFPTNAGGIVLWIDYDGDGWMDFIFLGSDSSNVTNNFAQMWRNTGNGFTNVPMPVLTNLTGVNAIMDYDGDGKPDILTAGLGVQLFRNTGNGFTNVPMPGLPTNAVSLISGSVSLSCADYDGDGRPDFLILAITNEPAFGAFQGFCRLYRNLGNDFTNVPIPGLPGYDGIAGSIAWGDFDGDGRPDFILGGATNVARLMSPQLWRNNTGVTNLPPTAPSGLISMASGPLVVLSWNAATDDHTPTAALTYNVRIGTTPGGVDVLSPLALPSGKLLVWQQGNAGSRLGKYFRPEVNHTYYWSVQAIDGAFVGGPFATEQQFSTATVLTPPNGIPIPGDANGDGIVSQSELAAVLANLNGDGIVSQSELDLVLSNYFPNSPWLYMTNVAGLGGTNVTFALSNSIAGTFSVEWSTNLSNWYPLGLATPRYLFTDTNAPALPQRFYRLRWP